MSEEPVELRERTWTGERLGPAEFAPNSDLLDLTLTECDIVGVVGQKSRVERVTINNSRLRGVSWAGGVVRDLLLENVTGSDVSLRFSSLRSVTFRDVELPELDFTNVEFEQVHFERCRLHKVVFDHARVKSLRIESCDLSGATGVLDLRGASMDVDDLASLAPSLAREVGILLH